MIDLETRIGTNYYANLGTPETPKLVHIGKAAYGIRYVIRCNPEHYTDFAGYAAFIKGFQIYNHFGNPVDSNYFLETLPGKPEAKSILPMFKKAGKKDLVNVMQQYDDKEKLVAKYDCVDMDFHRDMTGVKLKRSVFDQRSKIKDAGDSMSEGEQP